MSQVVIITGGGRGIGAATALLAAQKGYAVCIGYSQQKERAEQVAATIRAGGGQAIVVAADVGDEAAVAAMFEVTEAELGPPTALVNNAGLTGRLGRLAEVETASLRQVLETNVLGTILCSREAVRRMSTRLGGTGGVIVNVSSRAAQHGSPNEFVHYAASKAAVEAFTFGLANEVATDGIRVNCVSPGLIATEIHAAMGDASRVETFAKRIPMQRAGQPEEVAAAIMWLLSPEASYSTGSILAVSGGR